MTTIAFLSGVALLVVSMWLVMDWIGDRIHQQMIDSVQEVLRSRTPDSSGQTGDCVDTPQGASPDRAGEVPRASHTFEAAPAPSTLAGVAAHHPPAAAPGRAPAPVGAGISRDPASTGPTPAGDGVTQNLPPTPSPAGPLLWWPS